MTFIPQYFDTALKRFVAECPFKVRDLKNDSCYVGSGVHRCKWFIRYDWEKHRGCIACNHPKQDQKPVLEGQLLFEF